MPSYRELLAEVKREIGEVDAREAQALLAGDDAPVLIDVRELDEFEQGAIPGFRAHPARLPRVAHRERRARPRDARSS